MWITSVTDGRKDRITTAITCDTRQNTIGIRTKTEYRIYAQYSSFYNRASQQAFLGLWKVKNGVGRAKAASK